MTASRRRLGERADLFLGLLEKLLAALAPPATAESSVISLTPPLHPC